jgi:branched-chain amino acid transport system ATP-binding protein
VTQVEPRLRVSALEKLFGPLKALSGVKLEVGPDEVRGLIGPNGSGTSTLLGIVAGGITPSSGRIWLDGREITGMAPWRRVRHGLAMKFQITRVLPELAVYDNLLLALQARSGMVALLRSSTRAALAERVEELLQLGYLDKVAFSPAGTLSHGEKQRLEIAMALAPDPRLLLLDEPTAGMSPEERRLMGELLSQIAPGRAIVIVEHDVDWVKRVCATITVLDHGRVVAEGPSDTIEQDERVRAIYVSDTSK